MSFRTFRVDRDTLFFFENYCEPRALAQPEATEKLSAKLKARGGKATENVSANPKEAKRPSNTAGLA